MADRMLRIIVSLVTLTCSVNSQQYNVAVDTGTACNGQIVPMGLVTTNGNLQLSTATPTEEIILTNGGTTLTGSPSDTQAGCIDICQRVPTCSAAMFSPACPNSVASCTILTSTEVSVTSQTLAASATSAACATRVFAKYCGSAIGRVTPASGSTDGNTGNTGNTGSTTTGVGSLTTNQWSEWLPGTACITSDGQRTRRRLCQGNLCETQCPTSQCTTTNGITEAVETVACSGGTTCDNTDQNYINLCALMNENFLEVADQCDNRKFHFCVSTNTKNWLLLTFTCPPTTRYDPIERICVDVLPGEIGYTAPAAAPVTQCNRFKVPGDVMKYRENGVEETCQDGYVFYRKVCNCYPGPGVSLSESNMISVLCTGDPYNAGGDLVSADPYPSRRRNQFITLGANQVCRFAQSNIMSRGLEIHGLSTRGILRNPSFSFWFREETASATGRQVLLTNRKVTNSIFSSGEPNIEVYLQRAGTVSDLYVTSSNIGSQVIDLTPGDQVIDANRWYFVSVVFDQSGDNLQLLSYLRPQGQAQPNNPVITPATSNTVMMQSTPMKVAYSGDPNNPDYFEGWMDDITVTRNTLMTADMVKQMSDVSPDSYQTSTA